MITLICTKCKATLEMDDAFAGGVCRCQYCGTIQTVPSHLKATSGVRSGPQKALYSTKAGAGAGLPSSGLDDLANVVASSGLASGLANRTATRVDAPVKAASKTPLIVGGAVGVAALLGVIVYLLISRPSVAPVPTQQTQNGPATPGPAPTPGQNQDNKIAGPHILDIPIAASKIVYLVDRGESNRDVLDPFKAALYESLESLGADRDFQIIFWTRPATSGDMPDVNEHAFPKGSMAKANADRIRECRNRLEDVTTSGRTDIEPAISEAMKRNPQLIVIVTAKGINLDESVVTQVKAARGGKPVIIHTIDLTSSADGMKVLQTIANENGGTYKHVSPSELRSR